MADTLLQLDFVAKVLSALPQQADSNRAREGMSSVREARPTVAPIRNRSSGG
jgi:hypothetical protein